MANYNDLKTGIDAVIKTNGRQEISGAALNTQLKNMIAELGAGYQYMGVATPATNPGTPDANVFYLASGAGTYTNFRGIIINEGEVCALVWDGTWTKEVTGIATADQLSQLGQKINDGDYYIGFPIEYINFDNSVVDSDTVFCIVNSGYSHIKRIEFVAKEGTIKFYKVIAPIIAKDLKVSKVLLTSVVNSAAEEGTIKGIDIDIDLNEGEHIGVAGTFVFKNASTDKACFSANSSNTIPNNPTNNLLLGFNVFSDIDSLSDLLDKRMQLPIFEYGIRQNGDSYNTPEYIFITKDESVGYPKEIRYIELPLSRSIASGIYIVTINGTTATAEQICSVKGSGWTKIPLNVTLSDNQYIGINGYVIFRNTGGGINRRVLSIPEGGGNVNKNPLGSYVSYVLYYAEKANRDNTVVVDYTGNGDYLTVFDALAGTLGKDSAEHPIHIKVMPGIYNEPTLPVEYDDTYCTNRHLSIVGVDKVNCILRNDKGYYNGATHQEGNLGDNAPLKISGNVYIANLTIISTDNDAVSDADVYHRSYCIHVDANAQQNCTLEVNNCVLINNHAPCIGFGIPKNCTLKITNCELYTTLYDTDDWNLSGAVVWGHDRINDPSTTEIQEHIIIKDCILKGNNCNAFTSVNNMNGLMDCVFINNAVDIPADKGVILGDSTTIAKLSYGNALSSMNYQAN